jgi:low affinity Fe/Cu permease
MKRRINHTTEHIKSIGWILLLVYIFLGLFAFISGRIIGYSIAIWICAGLAVIISIVFASIVLFNIAVVSGFDIIKRLLRC